MRKDLPESSLDCVNIAVLGLGDSSYVKYVNYLFLNFYLDCMLHHSSWPLFFNSSCHHYYHHYYHAIIIIMPSLLSVIIIIMPTCHHVDVHGSSLTAHHVIMSVCHLIMSSSYHVIISACISCCHHANWPSSILVIMSPGHVHHGSLSSHSVIILSCHNVSL